MNTEIELRKWLNRPDKDTHTNLLFGLKAWHSMELTLPTKYEIIIEELCNNLLTIARNTVKLEAAEQSHVWEKVLELLALTYSTGAVNVQIKAKLIEKLTEVVNHSLKKGTPSLYILNALQATLHNTSMLNYYKSSGKDFARFIATNLRYLIAILIDNTVKSVLDVHVLKEKIDGLLNSVRTYIRQTPHLETFKEHFSANVFVVLTELIILLKNKHNLNYASEHIAITQELYFDGSQTKELKEFLQRTAETSHFASIFNVPIHAHLTTVETVLISFKNDTDLLANFFTYLFNDNFNGWTTVTNGRKDLLDCFSYLLFLLKKHDISLNFDINNVKAHIFLGKHIESLVNECFEQLPFEAMNVVCSALRLNPLILEHTAVQISVKFMLIPKNDEHIWQKYEELMFLLIEMFRKLCRAEKLVAQLIKNTWETLNTVKLSKKLKRRLNQTFTDTDATPTKQVRNNDDVAEPIQNSPSNTKLLGNVDYFKLLKSAANISSENPVTIDRQISKEPSTQNWVEIAFAFPPSVAACFRKLVSGLVSKPSLVVWKTLLFTLKDYISTLAENGADNENTIFFIEMICALLSQYFCGSRLAEQADKSWMAIETIRKQTNETLSHFGHVILNQEHNYRTMNVFLKLCYNVSNFDLVCWYYCPDSMIFENADAEGNSDGNDGIPKINGSKNAQDIHSYLSPKEWTIIEQRITNFGKRVCKSNINQIYLQRIKANVLFHEDSDQSIPENIARTLLSSTFSDIEQIIGILEDEFVGPWFLRHLDNQQKQVICELVLDSEEQDLTILCNERIQNKEYSNILILTIYKFINRELCAGKKANLLKNLAFDATLEINGLEALAQSLAEIIKKYTNKEEIGISKIKQETHNSIMKYLNLLNALPIGFCTEELKSVLILFTTIFYHNFKSAGDDILCCTSFNIFQKILHFDHFPAVFQFITIDSLIQIFSHDLNALDIFDMIFDRVSKNLNEHNQKMLQKLLELLDNIAEADETQQNTLINIACVAVVQLSKNKKAKDHFESYRKSLLNIIQKQLIGKLTAQADIAQFVKRTLPAFVIILKAIVGKSVENIDDQLIQVTKTFLSNSIVCKNSDSVKLLNVILNNKAHLRYSDEELKQIIDQFWTNFKECCADLDDNQANLETILKIIFDFKSTEEWINLLNDLDDDIKANAFTTKGMQNNRILSFMSKCQLNKAKGQIYSEFYKQITFWLTLTLRTKENQLKLNNQYVLDLIRNHITIVNNVQIPVSLDLIDDILALMSELNIKKFDFLPMNVEESAKVLRETIELCQALINQRHFFIMDRVSQFVHIFKDLLQSVCWYKSQRSKTENLDAAEITILAEMAHNLEKISKSLVSHGKELKRVAPYVLVFVINLMISNDRPLTLYPKIKTHFEYICYDFIAICDHRVDGFILRCCNEASKPVYENLVKEYQKYHKFKGKV